MNTSEELHAVRYISYTSASLGIMGSLFIIVTYLFFKESKTLGTHLVFCLSIADLIRGVMWFPWDKTGALCIAQAVLTQFSEFASFLWAFSIALCLFLTYYMGATEELLKRFMVWWQILCWGAAMGTAAIPMYGNRYGHLLEEEEWCWISRPTDPERLLLFVPCLAIFVLNTLAFFLIAQKLRSNRHFFVNDNSLQKNMALYLLSFLLSQAPSVANRLYIFFNPNDNMLSLLILQALFQPLQGFFDMFAYGVTDPTFTANYHRIAVRLRLRRKYTQDNIQEAGAVYHFDYEYHSQREYTQIPEATK